MTEFVIIGAGIIGLSTAYTLIEHKVDPAKITVVAQHLPGDLSIDYASPYAGAYFCSLIDDDKVDYAAFTYKNLTQLRQKLGGDDNSGIDTVKSTDNAQEPLSPEYLSKIQFLEDLSVTKSNVPGFTTAVSYKAFVFNPPLLTSNLVEYLTSKGVVFQKTKLAHINEAFDYAANKSQHITVFNCTGNGSAKLGGVEDPQVMPVRGQVVVIRAPHIKECVAAWGDDASTYVIKRPHSNLDEVILGGFYQKGRYDPTVHAEETADILRRTTQLCPQILTANPNGDKLSDLQIVRVVAGSRPGRQNGVRIEKEQVSSNRTVVHNYGATGEGYLSSLGMANKAVQLALSPQKRQLSL